jgi:hypothetical protein
MRMVVSSGQFYTQTSIQRVKCDLVTPPNPIGVREPGAETRITYNQPQTHKNQPTMLFLETQGVVVPKKL